MVLCCIRPGKAEASWCSSACHEQHQGDTFGGGKRRAVTTGQYICIHARMILNV